MLLIFAGSPCQQLTRAGFFQGWQGLCGPESVHFFIIPCLVWAIHRHRPDLVVQVVVENAASMRDIHCSAILALLGDLDARTHRLTLDTIQWAHTPRERHFFGTFPVDPRARLPPRRPRPWDHGWAPRWDGATAVMMCSRGPPPGGTDIPLPVQSPALALPLGHTLA